MPKKTNVTVVPDAIELDAFDRLVQAALEHCSEYAWLGEHSPLAAPYFIGRFLSPEKSKEDEPSVVARGRLLSEILLRCTEQVDAEMRALLNLAFFQRNRYFDNVRLALQLNMSERTFYRMRLRAIKHVAHLLNQAVLPPLRPETPANQVMFGRSDTLTAVSALLHARRSVYLAGPSGIGKSTLGGALARQWSATSGNIVFWYTLRRQMNDTVVSLVFALCHQLRSHGRSAAWRQLVADRGLLDSERILSLLRFDLESLAPAALLLCIDDVDVLQDDSSAHAQIAHFVEALRPHAAILLLGQRILIDADNHMILDALPLSAAHDLLDHLGLVAMPEQTRMDLLKQARGIPALLVLTATLVRLGEDPADTASLLTNTPSLEGIFHRIWRRLDKDERDILMQLAVYRTPAPQDEWRDAHATLLRLHARQLININPDGTVHILPHLHQHIYERIPVDLRRLLHLRAASIRAERAEIVAAMYHAIQGQQPAHAVWLWFTRRSEEVERGQGLAALQILQQIALGDMPDPRDRTALLIARGELYELTGRPDVGEVLGTEGVQDHDVLLSAYMRLTAARVQEAEGNVERALDHYRASINHYLGLPHANEAFAHTRLAFLHMYRRHDVDNARRDAVLAKAKADTVLADMEIMAGHYQVALTSLLEAEETLAAYPDELTARSRIYSFLGALYGRLGDVDTALSYSDRAIACDRQRGDEVGPLYDILNKAAALHVANRHQEAYHEALMGLAVAERIRNAYLIAGLAAGAAEACCGLGEWAQAEHYAEYALSQEEAFFRPSACTALSLVRHAAGRYDEALSYLDVALDGAQEIADRYTEANVQRVIAVVMHASGRDEVGDSALDAALHIFTELGLAFEVNRTHELIRHSQP